MFGFIMFGQAEFAGQPFFTAGTAIVPVVAVPIILTLKGGDGGTRRRREIELQHERDAAEAEAREEEDIELMLSVWLNLR